jgi:hypothetical protein
MTSKPTFNCAIDDLTAKLLTTVEELGAQLRANIPVQVIKQKASVIRDLADELHATIEDLPKARKGIIKQAARARKKPSA